MKQVSIIFQKYLDQFLLFLFPILLIFINSNWIFTPVTDYMPDAWFYLANFRNFIEIAPEFPSNTHYFIERLTWNIPGFIIHQLFPPLAANYILHLGVWYIAVFSFYYTTKNLFNQRTALVGAMLLGSYPWFLRATGWDYVDGTGVAHFLLLLLLLTNADNEKYWRYRWYFIGIVHASLLITNLFWIGLAPGWLLYYLYVNFQKKENKLSKFFREAIYFGLGNLTLVILLAMVYHRITGDFFFLRNSVFYAVLLSTSEQNIQSVTELYGHITPLWHILPILASIATIFVLLEKSSKFQAIIGAIFPEKNKPDVQFSNILSTRENQREFSHSFMAVVILFATVHACLIFWHFTGVPYLIIFPYTSYAIPATFLLIAGLLANQTEKHSPETFRKIIISTPFILASPLILVSMVPEAANLQGKSWLIAMFCLIFLVLVLVGNKKKVIVPLIMVYSILYLFVGENSYVYITEREKGKNNYLAIIKANQVIDAHYPNHQYKDLRMWFREDPNYNTFFSLAATYLYPWGSAIGQIYSGMPRPDTLVFSDNDRLVHGDKLVILSSNANVNDVLLEANNAIKHRNGSIQLEKIVEIKNNTLHFYMYFVEIFTQDAR